MRPLEGKVCVITGAGRGIGRATALAFAHAGARLALCSRTEAELAETAELVRPAKSVLSVTDLASRLEVARFAEIITTQLGVPDVLVHNAGSALRQWLEATEEADWDRVMDVNLKAIFLLTKPLLPAMRARKSGRILCVSSISGRQGTARSVAYCAAKHGVVGFVRALAEEVGPDGIVVNAVCPGSVETTMLPPEFAPGMPPEEVAQTLLWLATSAPLSLTGACIDQFGSRPAI